MPCPSHRVTLPRSIGVSVEVATQVRTHRPGPPTRAERDQGRLLGEARPDAKAGSGRDDRLRGIAITPGSGSRVRARRRKRSCRASKPGDRSWGKQSCVAAGTPPYRTIAMSPRRSSAQRPCGRLLSQNAIVPRPVPFRRTWLLRLGEGDRPLGRIPAQTGARSCCREGDHGPRGDETTKGIVRRRDR